MDEELLGLYWLLARRDDGDGVRRREMPIVCMYCIVLSVCLSVCGWLWDIIFFIFPVRCVWGWAGGQGWAGRGCGYSTAQYSTGGWVGGSVGGGGVDTEARGEICGWRSGGERREE